MSTPSRDILLLIDGHSMAFRAFYAMSVDAFATATGQPTNAVYGFMLMLTKVLADEKPTHVAVAFDVSRVTFRTALYPQYKGTRGATPEEFKGQVPLIKEVLAAMNIVTVEKDDYEADDIIATMSRQGVDQGMDVLICSGDRDALQLVDDHTTVLYPIKGVSELARMTPAAVEAKYGVSPGMYPDLAALVGEKSDNLPGVPGVGPKTAAKWLTTYGGLDGVVEHVSEIPGKAGQSLRDHLTQVVLNRQLGGLVRDLDLSAGVGQTRRLPMDRRELADVFAALDFGPTLRDRILALGPGEPDPADDPAWAMDAALHVTAVEPGGLGAWLTAHSGDTAGLDVEGQLGAGTADAWNVAVADADGEAVSLDLSQLDPADDTALAGWLSDAAAHKAIHGAKAAWHELDGRGIALRGVTFDTELAAYLRFPEQRGYDLSDLAERLGVGPVERDNAAGQGVLDIDGQDDRGAARALAVLRVATTLGAQLEERGQLPLLTQLELPLVDVLARMERCGIAVDAKVLQDLHDELTSQVDMATQQAYAAIDREVNLGSPKQLQEVLFDQLGMPPTKRTKTGYTTDAEALAELFAKTQHPFLAALLAHRDAIKLRQMVETLQKAVAPDGRIHTTFSQTVAATGRLASADPNLQNIPIRTETGRRVRGAFVVGAGFEGLMTADYSQIEMRIMAHLSRDEGLIAAFNSGEDLHSFVASQVFGVQPDQVTASQRSKIKAMSYGLAYGLSAFGLSRQLSISVGEAGGLRDQYFDRFGGIRTYLDGVVAQARRTGYTATIMGRRRYLPDLTSDNAQRRDIAERAALNAPIQGSAADIIKVAMLGVDRELTRRALASRMLLQVHDELVVEVAPGERDEVEAVLREQMGSAAQLSVPLVVSVGYGPSWETAGH